MNQESALCGPQKYSFAVAAKSLEISEQSLRPFSREKCLVRVTLLVHTSNSGPSPSSRDSLPGTELESTLRY